MRALIDAASAKLVFSAEVPDTKGEETVPQVRQIGSYRPGASNKVSMDSFLVERSPRSRRIIAGMIGVLALLTFAGSTASSAEAHPVVASAEAPVSPYGPGAFPLVPPVFADTIPAGSGLFQGRLLFGPRYLMQVVRKVTVKSAEELATDISLSADASEYARRYDISTQLAEQIVESAVAEKVDPELAFRLVRVESVFRANARGPNGALGLTQLMPSTARSIDRSLRTEAQIMDPVTNLRTGFRYLREMIERYNGDVRLGVLAYNRGEGAVDRALRSGTDPENGYSSKVLGSTTSRYLGRGTIGSEE